MTDLGRYHNDTVGALKADEDRFDYVEEHGAQYDRCTDLAIQLLLDVQVESDDSPYIGPAVPDALDVPVSEDVQTLLTLAMFRFPQLADYIEELMQHSERK